MNAPSAPPLDGADRGRFETALYGLIAYRELTAFERLSSDARFSPTLADRTALARLAAAEFGHYELVAARIAERGGDPIEAMEPFRAAIDELHERTRPGDWFESLMKAYVIDAVSGDFYLALAAALDGPAWDLAGEVQSTGEQTGWVLRRLRGAIAEDRPLASRLALWGRRLLAEALMQARRVGEELGFRDDGLAPALIEAHTRRMADLGLTA